MFGEISMFAMIVLIVLIVTVGRIYAARHGLDISRRGRRDRVGFDPRAAEESERLRHEVTRLNERIQVLERLATDPAKRLSNEIDALDDRRN